jgi:lysozyme
MRYTNYDGVQIIKSFEGIEDGNPSTVNLDPYIDPVGIWTIGWGHAINYEGSFLTVEEDPNGDIASSLFPEGISYHEAENLLFEDLVIVQKQVDGCVEVYIHDNQFSALVSFTFNVGIGNLLQSTLLKKLNMGDYLGAANEFPKWRKSNGQVFNGLVRRREAERNLFLKNRIKD